MRIERQGCRGEVDVVELPEQCEEGTGADSYSQRGRDRWIHSLGKGGESPANRPEVRPDDVMKSP